MQWEDRYKQFQKFCLTNRAALLSCFDASWNGINFAGHEPDIIEEYLHSRQNGVAYLNSKCPSNPNYDIRFSGVFVHKRPKIIRTAPCASNDQCCELGDLMIVFSFLDAVQNPIINRAFLVQAKKTFKMSSVCQQQLYDGDDSFEFSKSVYRNSLSCNSSGLRWLPATPDRRWRSLKYLILKGTPPTIVYTPWDLSAMTSWSLVFLWLMMGQDGLGFTTSPVPGQRWSAIVWDLIDVVGSKMLHARKRGTYRDIIAASFGGLRTGVPAMDRIVDGEGISTLFIWVRDKEAAPSGQHRRLENE